MCSPSLLIPPARASVARRSHYPRGFRSVADRELARSITRGDGKLPMLGDCATATLARSPMGRAVDLHLFPGRSTDAALVIGGVHGTEFVGVEVTRRLVTTLRAERGRGERPFFTTAVVPALFPDNLPSSHGGHRRARRATRGRADPNRQFPVSGTGLEPSVGGSGTGTGSGTVTGETPRDARGRPIERENVALIELIRQLRPVRIASVHAIGRPSFAGIYCDPDRRAGTALGDEAADLARRMHVIASTLGGQVPGSADGTGRYPRQSEVSGQGVSLGEWGSQSIETGPYRRRGIPVITIELKRDWPANEARRRCVNVEAFMRAIRRGFLERAR